MSPSKPSSSNTRVCAAGEAAYDLPIAMCSGLVSSGTSWPMRRLFAEPRRCSAARVSRLATRSHASPSSLTPLDSISWTVRRHSGPTSPVVHAACASRATSGVITQSVRRIAWCRTTLCCSYSASLTAASDGWAIRASAER